MPRLTLAGKGIVITGAAHGLGRELALALDALGCTLVLVDRDAPGLEQLSGGLGGKHETLVCNLGNLEDRKRLIGDLAARPNISMLVNCAGIGSHSRLEQLTVDEIESVMQVNALAPLELSAALASLELIVNIGSVAGEMPLPSMSLYAAGKASLHAFARSLQLEGRRVLLVILGPLRGTDFVDSIKHPRTGQPKWYRDLDVDAKVAAREIVHAMLAGQDELLLPHWYRWVFRAYALAMLLGRLLGITKVMRKGG